MKTRTGGFSIGWRNRELSWEETLEDALAFGARNGLAVIDLKNPTLEAVRETRERGLQIGSVDLPNWQGMTSADAQRRKEAIEENCAYVQSLAAVDVEHFFVCMLPEDPELPRKENFERLVESYTELGKVMESCGADLVIEGWPGRGCLVSTPESYRLLLEQTPESIGVNYDPSHLVRMGIDPIRFLKEFLPRVYHCHGKDCWIDPERLYEHGTEVEPVHGEKPPYAGYHWRYTIPGHGMTPWIPVMELLRDGGYAGAICIELEDVHFNETPELQMKGVVEAARFLSEC